MKEMYKLTPSRKYFATVISVLFFNQMLQAQTLQVSLTASNYNGFNISCFGVSNGNITANVTGGTPPYTFSWSNDETSQIISDLAAGYYRLDVYDSNNKRESAEITLTQPEQLHLDVSVFEYPNGYEISLNGACNGIISSIATGGTTPYYFMWDDNSTIQNRSALCVGNHSFTLTDANGCELNSEQYTLNQPERSDWTQTGNTGSNPSTNFIGTTDSVSVSFRTNNQERLKIGGNGQLKISSVAGTDYEILYADSIGNVVRYVPPTALTANTAWLTTGNPQTNNNSFIGTTNNIGLRFRTYDIERMKIQADGNLCYNCTTQTNTIASSAKVQIMADADNQVAFLVRNWADNSSKSFEVLGNGEVYARDIIVKTGTFPDYVFTKNYHLLNLDELKQFIDANNHLPNMPPANEVVANGLNLCNMQVKLTEKIEELTLYILELNNRLKNVEADNQKLQTLLNSKK